MRASVFGLGGLLLVALTGTVSGGQSGRGLELIDEYRLRAIESEVGGIYPHPTNDDLYYVAANRNPAYGQHQHPTLPVEHRGKLLTINRRTGEIVGAIALGGSAYGGIASDGKRLFVSSLSPAEVLVVDPDRGRVERRIPLPAPAGGLEYDARSGRLLAQVYLKHPHLAVVDPKSGTTVDTLWSDESAMDLKVVDGDLLCTWVSSFDASAFSELRRIDPATGRVTGRMRLDGIYSSIGRLDRKVAGVDGFIALVTTDKERGLLQVRKYAYDKRVAAW